MNDSSSSLLHPSAAPHQPDRSSASTAQVTIVGAGNVGSTLAQRILERNLADVVLVDVVAGRPQGVALDLAQAAGCEGHNRTIVGTNDYADTAHSALVVITAGLPRRPGMTRDDLTQVNGQIVIDTVRQALAASPGAAVMVVTNPLDVMTYLAWRASGLPPHRVMGMAGVLDSARFQRFIAWELGVPPQDVDALVLGGHGDLMVPLPSYTTVSGIPITELLPSDRLQALIDRTRNGGAEIVQLLKQGGAYYAPASAACAMVQAILQNQRRILPLAAYLSGQYGLKDLYLGVPCRLGQAGVETILELPLSDAEQAALAASAASVQAQVQTALGLLNLEPQA